MKKKIGADALIESLENLDVKYIFGVPGDIENEFFARLKNSDMKFVTVRHEQSGAFMADVYSRLTGKLGVAFSTLGPGATNMLTGIANAMQERSSVLALSGQLPQSKHHDDSHQFVNLEELYKPVTKAVFMPKRPQDISEVISTAANVALKPRKGPVHVSLPTDVMKGDALGHRIVKNNETIEYNFNDQLEELDQILLDSEKIVAIIGPGVARSGVSEELVTFLENRNIPAYTSFHGKGTIPANHELNAGVLSRHSVKAKKVLGSSDLVLCIGYDIIEGVTPDIWEGAQKIVHIDSSTPTGGGMYNPDLEVVGPLDSILKTLSNKHDSKKEIDMNELKLTVDYSEDLSEMYPMHPARIMQILNNVLEEKDIVTSDVGLHKQFVGFYFDVNKPNKVIFSNGYSSMGFSVPAGIAAKIACPESKVVSVTGDGGFQMNIQELATAVELETPVVYLVMNDNALGMVKKSQTDNTGTVYGAEYKSTLNYAKIGESFGALGFKIDNPNQLEEVLNEALNSNKVCVIDVPIQQYTDIELMK